MSAMNVGDPDVDDAGEPGVRVRQRVVDRRRDQRADRFGHPPRDLRPGSGRRSGAGRAGRAARSSRPGRSRSGSSCRNAPRPPDRSSRRGTRSAVSSATSSLPRGRAGPSSAPATATDPAVARSADATGPDPARGAIVAAPGRRLARLSRSGEHPIEVRLVDQAAAHARPVGLQRRGGCRPRATSPPAARAPRRSDRRRTRPGRAGAIVVGQAAPDCRYLRLDPAQDLVDPEGAARRGCTPSHPGSSRAPPG